MNRSRNFYFSSSTIKLPLGEDKLGKPVSRNLAGGGEDGVGYFGSKNNTGRIQVRMLSSSCTGTGCCTGMGTFAGIEAGIEALKRDRHRIFRPLTDHARVTGDLSRNPESMPVSYTVANYKSFVERTRIELRPLTLFFGYNNAGKSALLRALPLIAESILGSGRGPIASGTASRDAGFEDLVSRFHPTRDLALGLSWQKGSSFSARIHDFKKLYRQIVNSFEVEHDGQRVAGRWIPEEVAAGRLGTRYELEMDGADLESGNIRFEGLLPRPENSDSLWSPILENQGRRLRRIAEGVQWLGSLRAAPERRFRPASAPPQRLTSDGGGFADILFFDKIERGGLLEEVSGWFEEHFGQIVDLHETADGAYLSLSPVEAASLQIPLADTGEGVAQVIPVLVALALARREATEGHPRVLALEQPELHLHPAAEVALSQQLVRTITKGKPPVLLVETHSENLLLSVQLLIARGEIRPSDVLLYWVERSEDGHSLVRPIEIDEEGQVPGWPEGVFSEDIRLARELFIWRRKKQSQQGR